MSLKITYWKGVFVADHQPGEEEAILKKGGFVQHEPTLCEPGRCRACRAKIGRRYWSAKIEDATRLRRYCTPRALATMGIHLDKLRESRAVDAHVDVPSPPGLEYAGYQRAGIAYAIKRKDTLFGDDMGLGKTIEALGVANHVRPARLLVVAPATLALNWRAEAEKWLVLGYRIVLPKTTEAVVAKPGERLLVVTNYEKISGTTPRRRRVKLEAVALDESTASRLKALTPDGLRAVVADERTPPPALAPRDGRLVARSGSHKVEAARLLGLPEVVALVLPRDVAEGTDAREMKKVRGENRLTRSLRAVEWDLAVFDEAQALKNPDSLRSIAVLGQGGLYHRSRRSLFLSGTPIENCPREIWPIAAAVCPAKFGDWLQYARRYCGLHAENRGGRDVWVADGSTNQSELQQRLRTSFMIRRLKRDVMPELPPKRRQLILLEDDVDWSKYPEFQRWKESYERDYDAALALLEVARTAEEYRRAARALESVTVAFEETSDCRHKTGLLKLPACLRHADEMLDAGLDCLVIYAHHRDILDQIYDHYGDAACIIHGDTKMEERMPIVQAFQAGRRRVFIGALKAAGVGITLTRASTVSFFETDWNPATILQGEDRLCRYGQKKMVQALHPVLDGSLDANMIQKVIRKQDVVDRILDASPEILPSRIPRTRPLPARS